MTLTLLDLYNSAASQEWAMYDSDAGSGAEFESSLVLAINKAITEIYASHDFPFRERVHVILTIPEIPEYDLPEGIIKKDKGGKYLVRYNSKLLNFTDSHANLNVCFGEPESFFISNDKIFLNPIPSEKGILTIEYMTLVVGENSNGEEIFTLKNDTDILLIPAYLEELAKEAIISRTMLKTIASENDENYSAYKKQADNALKLLIKYAKGVEQDKKVIW